MNKIKTSKNPTFIEIEKELKILRIKNLKKKLGLVITVTTQKFDSMFKIFPIRILDGFVCLPIGIKNDEIGIKIVKKFDGYVDVFFVDAENKLFACQDLLKKAQKNITKSKVCALKGNDFTADAACAIILTIFKNVSNKRFCIVGSGNIGSKVALKLVELGSNVYILNSTTNSSINTASAINSLKPKECPQKAKPITKSNIPKNLDGVLGFTRGIPAITIEMINKVKKNGIVLDGGMGNISNDAISFALKRKLMILKLDIRMGFMSQATLMLNTEKLISEIFGMKKIEDFKIVSGGYYGEYGDVVVDNINNPQKILGISNGVGGLLDKSKSKQFDFKIKKKIISKE